VRNCELKNLLKVITRQLTKLHHRDLNLRPTDPESDTLTTYVNVNAKTAIAKRLAVQFINLGRMQETQKISPDDENFGQRNGSDDVTGKFVPQFRSSYRKRPIADSDEPHQTDK